MEMTRVHYEKQPDYTRPLLDISAEARKRVLGRLGFLYGDERGKNCMAELERVMKVHYAHKPPELIEAELNLEPTQRFTERDCILITYGDLLRSEERSPLATLTHFLEETSALREVINTLHILPFFPYSSDRGFSVIDFDKVDPKLGSWQDVENLSNRFQLMFDGVFNHISSESKGFQEMLNGHPYYRDFFTIFQSPDELTAEQRQLIVRPRTSDILTKFQSINGPIWVWTTFSPDQIDLKFQTPEVLTKVVETLLLYVRQGADIIRLDAVTYLWDEPGTSGASLKQTHQIVKLLRDILAIVAPSVALITETNVPHEENVSYFGDGSDEAQMVYNFALPPLVLYTFYREDATVLSKWANELEYPSRTTTFFNMLDTHDGIGLKGVTNILSDSEIEFLVRQARHRGAFVSYKSGEFASSLLRRCQARPTDT